MLVRLLVMLLSFAFVQSSFADHCRNLSRNFSLRSYFAKLTTHPPGTAREAVAEYERLKTRENPLWRKEGQAELKDLILVNQKLSQDLQNGIRLTAQDLIDQGLVALGQTEVKPLGESNTGFLKAVEILFPKSKTGALVSTHGLNDLEKHQLPVILNKAYNPAMHADGLAIFLPGNGSDSSVARSVFEVANIFHRGPGKSKGQHRQRVDINARLASFAVDLPKNGLGMDAPDSFLTEQGAVEVIRNVRLILAHLYGSEIPFYIAGRSFGAAVALAYGHRYSDVNGVIGVNPFMPHQLITEYNYNVLVNPTVSPFIFGKEIQSHWPSYLPGLKQQEIFSFAETPSQVPELILIGDKDPSFGLFNPQDHTSDTNFYLSLLRAYQSAKSEHQRLVVTIPNASHHLWDKHDPAFQEVVGHMERFFQQTKARP